MIFIRSVYPIWNLSLFCKNIQSDYTDCDVDDSHHIFNKYQYYVGEFLQESSSDKNAEDSLSEFFRTYGSYYSQS